MNRGPNYPYSAAMNACTLCSAPLKPNAPSTCCKNAAPR